MKNNVLEIKHVAKSFGSKTIFTDINLTLQGGQIYGLVGPNGSGKSVFLKILCGLMSCEGTIVYNGKKLTKENAYKANIGASIEKPQFIENLSGLENLKFLASFRNKVKTNELLKWLEIFHLLEAKDKPVQSYSLGMKQKLSIIQAMMEDQNIILLDEVSNSLDKTSKKILFQLIHQAKQQGKIILYVNHNLDEVARMSDIVLEIDEGAIVLCEDLEEL